MSGGEPGRILIVDDDEAARYVKMPSAGAPELCGLRGKSRP
jgi:hypothetical protein